MSGLSGTNLSMEVGYAVLKEHQFKMKATLPQRAWTIGIHYRRELHRYLLRRLRRPQDLDDLTQEVYMRLLRMDRMECIREPLAYLYSIAANVVADFTLSEPRRHAPGTPDDAAVEARRGDAPHAVPD